MPAWYDINVSGVAKEKPSDWRFYEYQHREGAPKNGEEVKWGTLWNVEVGDRLMLREDNNKKCCVRNKHVITKQIEGRGQCDQRVINVSWARDCDPEENAIFKIENWADSWEDSNNDLKRLLKAVVHAGPPLHAAPIAAKETG